jgi:hypothetical protein
MIDRVFLDHPRRVGESYGEHAAVAARFGATLVVAGLACLVHAVIPSVFTRTASDTVRRLHARLSARKPAPTAEWQLTYEI